jgi:hypothetical protein
MNYYSPPLMELNLLEELHNLEMKNGLVRLVNWDGGFKEFSLLLPMVPMSTELTEVIAKKLLQLEMIGVSSIFTEIPT